MKIVLIVLLGLVAGGCKSDPKPGEPVSFETVCGRSTTGAQTTPQARDARSYLSAPRMMMQRHLHDGSLPDISTRRKAREHFAGGDDENQMSELPKEYSDADVKLRTKDGKTVGIGQKIRSPVAASEASRTRRA
jgi:hypothetical protein